MSLRTALWRAASLPPALAHELTHLVLSLPWADSAALVFEGGHAGLHVDWRDSAPTWGIVLAAYGPLLVGTIIGGVGLATLVLGGAPELRWWPYLGLLACWWAIYVTPSADDRRTAQTATAGHDTADTNQ
jgi:hypothetical protein